LGGPPEDCALAEIAASAAQIIAASRRRESCSNVLFIFITDSIKPVRRALEKRRASFDLKPPSFKEAALSGREPKRGGAIILRHRTQAL
jgi:hypothetical protein